MLDTIFNAAALITLWTVILIYLLLLDEIGVFKRVNAKIKKNPKFRKAIFVFGDTLYGIGISIVGSVLFVATGFNVFTYKLFLGICLIIVGAYIRK